MDFSGKTFFISGAANGIGKHLVKEISKKGGFVYAADIQEEKLIESIKGNIQIVTFKLDVRNSKEWDTILTKAFNQKPIDYLINVAGIIRPGYIYEQVINEIDVQIDINLKGTIYGCHYFSRILKTNNRKGHIINIASMAALAPVGGLNAYTASKFGVRGFTLAIRQELRPYGIDVSVVCPDAVETGMLDLQKNYKEAAMTFSSNKILTVEDVVKAILEEVIQKKKIEIRIPFDRGLLAAFGGNFPAMSDLLYDAISKKGIKNQAKYKR